jgi:hypothetical protein
MKRVNGLFEKITAFENLLWAALAAYRGKRFRRDPAAFHHNLEANLFKLQAELESGQYQPGAYRSFYIHDPKRRLISAAPYCDRVVHHAVCQGIEPIFDRAFIFDSYANRLGKGTHRALDRASEFCRQARYALKCDVEKFFPSIDHGILLKLLQRKIKCARTLRLLEQIIAASNPQEEVWRYFPEDDLFTPHERRRGIPIGNLTSQFFGNVMLDPLDHHVKEALCWPRYLRFADDFLVFGNDKPALHDLLARLRCFLARFRLSLHPHKCVICRVADGVPFCGWQLFVDHRRLRRSTGVRFQRKLRALQLGYGNGEADWAKVKASLASWIGHLKHGDTYGLRRKLLADCVFSAPAAALRRDPWQHARN